VISRRYALAALPATAVLASCKEARACSPELINPRKAGLQEAVARDIFQAWFMREKEAFIAHFKDWKTGDGESLKGLVAPEKVDVDNALILFSKFFNGKNQIASVATVLNFGGDLLVDCHERGRDDAIQSDCSGMPQGHLFMLEMFGNNAARMSHIKSRSIPMGGYVSGINFNG
jgi:hypothetical protein